MRFPVFLLILVCFSIAGCSLWPKKVSFFQDKVEKAPEKTEEHLEIQKEAADYIYNKTEETVRAAIKENSSTNVLKPAVESHIVANSLSDSLGKPEKPFTKEPAEVLSRKLDRIEAKFDSKFRDFVVESDKNAGKKIEDTGFSIGFFTQYFLIGIVVFVGWIVIKVLGLLNPAVGVGTKVLSGGFRGITSLASRGFTEIIEGGANFLKKVDETIEDPETKEKIKELFKQSQKEKQSRDVQEVVGKFLK